MLTLRDLEMGTGGSMTAGHPIDLDQQVRAVATDSRSVESGDLFVAIRGERLDGHDFIAQAVRAGATAVLLSRFPAEGLPRGVTLVQVEDTVRALGQLAAYWRRRMTATVIGITGSVGKTTTKEVLAAVLGSRFRTLRSQKSLNNEIGVPLSLLSLEPEVEMAVLEIGGAYALGEIEYLCSLALPRVGVVTNVGYSHIGRMGSLERIAQTKSELVACLPPDGLAVLNADDPYVRQMAGQSGCPVVWYGLDGSADVRADEVESNGLEGVRFRMSIDGESYYVKAPLLGKQSVHAVLAAAAVAHAEGMDAAELIAAIRNLPPALRLVVTRGVNGSTLIDDTYNASPASMLAALNLLNEVQGPKIAVLGDMAELGDYADAEHLKVGARAAEVCDSLYTVGPLSRAIADGALQAGMRLQLVHRAESTEVLLAELRRTLKPDDTVLLKGSRAMELDKLAGALSVPAPAAR